MKKILLLVFVSIFSICANAQEKLDLVAIADSIASEGKMLYTLEGSSWVASELFLKDYKEEEKIMGYFSYFQDETVKCVFYSGGENNKILGSVSFLGLISAETADISNEKRELTEEEQLLYTLLKEAHRTVYSDTDGFFHIQENAGLNFIPLAYEGHRRVYIILGANATNLIPIGNDYILTFNQQNKLIAKEKQHKGYIPLMTKYGDSEIRETSHSHVADHSPFMTATDVCTFMLYDSYNSAKSHNVLSKDYYSIWNCETYTLEIITKEEYNTRKK